MKLESKIKSIIRVVPNFPKPKVLFKDITTLLKDGKSFSAVMDWLDEKVSELDVEIIVGMESRGFIFGAAIAARLKKGFVPVRKPGRLPAETHSVCYDLEYGQDVLEIHKDAILPGTRVAIVDDLLATGGTAKAATELIKKCDGIVAGNVFVIELEFFHGKSHLEGKVYSLVKYPD